MNKTKKIMLALLVALTLCLSMVAFAVEGEMTLTLEPTASTVSGGQNFEVVLSVAENPGFRQGEFMLHYDAEALQVLSVSTELCAFPADTLSVNAETAGVITVNVASMTEIEGEHTGTGRVFSVQFQVAEEFVGEVTLTTATALTVGEGEVTVQEISRTITVEAPSAHQHTEEVIPMQRATCTEPGWTEGVKCAECGEILVAPQYIVPYGHTPSQSVPENVVPASCQSDGSYESVIYCSICGVELSRETVAIPSTGEHNYATEQERVDPTCTEDGYVIMACECGETQTETLSATGHKEVTDEAVAATCTENGWTGGSHCEVCGEILVAQEEILATGHTPGEAVRENENPASCQNDGSYDLVTYCSVCGEELDRQTETVSATGDHASAVEQERVDPTCTEDGYVTKVCECGETWTEVLLSAGHTEVVDAAVAATCTENGWTEGSHCEVCGVVLLEQEEILATGHTEIVLQGYAATCTVNGLTNGMICSTCGTITVAQEQTPLADHSEEFVPGKAATCTEPGLTDGTACAFCELVMTPQEKIPALGHTEIYVSEVPSTCSAPGRSAGTMCVVCEQVLSGCQEIDKLSHTPKTVSGVAPTCTTEGKTEGVYCEVCNYIIREQTVIPPADHTPQVIPGQAATCTETGWTEGSRCGVCNEVLQDSQVIPTVEHTPLSISGFEATCSKPGLTDGQLCNYCGTILKAQQEIPVTDHQYDHSCDINCNACGAARVSLEHSFGNWSVVRQATEEAPGEQARTCANCGHKESRVISMLEPRKTENRGLIIGIAYVIMACGVVVTLFILRRKKTHAEE